MQSCEAAASRRGFPSGHNRGSVFRGTRRHRRGSPPCQSIRLSDGSGIHHPGHHSD
jgi:hypothetical protein